MPRPDVRDERIPQILDAATEVFGRNGIDGASMSEIAEAAEVSKATIYHYFAGKEQLILALVRRLFSADAPAVERLSREESSAISRLTSYAEELAELLEQNLVLATVLAEVHARAYRFPALQAAVAAYFDGYIELVRTVLSEGIERGEISRATKPGDAAAAYVALVEGALLLARHRNESTSSLLRRSVGSFLGALKA